MLCIGISYWLTYLLSPFQTVHNRFLNGGITFKIQQRNLLYLYADATEGKIKGVICLVKATENGKCGINLRSLSEPVNAL